MPESSRFRIILSLACAVLLLGGLVALVTRGGDDGADTVTAGSKGSTTTEAPGGSDGTALEAGGQEDAGQDATATTAPGAGSTATTAGKQGGEAGAAAAPAPAPAGGDPGPAQPTKPGSYTYEVTVDGEASESSHVVENMPGAAPGETRQMHNRKGKEGELKNQVLWKADGLYLEKSSGSGGGGISGDCDWNPDVLVVKLPLAKDSRWVSESSCSGTSPYGPYTLKARFESVVSGTARVTVGGQPVDVWIIDTTQHIDITAQYQGQQFTAAQDGTSKNFYAPKAGLSVREETQSTATTPAGERKSSSTRVLKSLTPR